MQVSKNETRWIGIPLMAAMGGLIFGLVFWKQGNYVLAIVSGAIGFSAAVIFFLNILLPVAESPFQYTKK